MSIVTRFHVLDDNYGQGSAGDLSRGQWSQPHALCRVRTRVERYLINHVLDTSRPNCRGSLRLLMGCERLADFLSNREPRPCPRGYHLRVLTTIQGAIESVDRG